MTWLLGRAFVEGALISGTPDPMRGFEYLQEAMLVSETAEHRFWALQEMVARLGSLDEGAKAKALIDQYQDEFTSAEQVATMAAWRQKIDELAAGYAEIRNTPDSSPLDSYLSTLQERLTVAQSRGDDAEVGYYQTLISGAEVLRPRTE
jgi:hypothetical protein